MSYPVFATGDVLNASDMNAVGLWLVKSQAISAGVASASIDDVFSATYDRYRIIFELNGTTAGSFAKFRMRVGGADATGNNYYRYGYSSAFAGALAGYNAGPENAFNVVGQWGGSLASTCYMDIQNPFNTVRTGWSVNVNDVGGGSSYNLNGVIDLTTSYTGFTVFCNAGNFNAGVVKVYGYRN